MIRDPLNFIQLFGKKQIIIMDPHLRQKIQSAYKNWDSLKCFSNFLAKMQYNGNRRVWSFYTKPLTATTADLHVPFKKCVLNYSGIRPGILTRKDSF